MVLGFLSLNELLSLLVLDETLYLQAIGSNVSVSSENAPTMCCGKVVDNLERIETMSFCDTRHGWTQFTAFAKSRCSKAAYENWLAPINVLEQSDTGITIEIPNIFVQQYLLDNYKKDLCAFLPVDSHGEPAITFVISEPKKKPHTPSSKTVIEQNNYTKPALRHVERRRGKYGISSLQAQYNR